MKMSRLYAATTRAVLLWTVASISLILFTMVQVSSTEQAVVKEAIRAVRFEQVLTYNKSKGPAGLFIIDKPLSDTEITELIAKQPVCLIINGGNINEVKEKFFSGKTSGLVWIDKWDKLTAENVNGWNDLIIHRDIAEDITTYAEPIIRDNWYCSIWYDLKDPTNILYLGTIGMDKRTAKHVSFKKILQNSRNSTYNFGIDNDLESKERLRQLLIHGME